MTRALRTLSLLALVLALATVARSATAQVRSAEEILKDLDAATMPLYNYNKDSPNTNYREEFFRQRVEVSKRRAALIGELHRCHPEHPSVADYLPERWETKFAVEDDYDTVLEETEALLKAYPDHPIVRYAWQWRAMSSMLVFSRAEGYDADRFLATIEDFIQRYRNDPQGSMMLYEAAAFHVRDQEKSVEVLRRIVNDFPKSGAARQAKWKLRQADGIGKPFELTFNDVRTDREVSIESLRGKIIVIDFWATWCAPCVAEMPRMTELYARWRPKKVEFIGVSLDAPEDQRGRDALERFLAEHDLPWPQFYQGGGWDSDFSSSWGIDSIPCVFVVDHQGNLAATNVGEKLEETVEALIAKRDAPKDGG